jgi:O-antigen/teichoic acid export membrane protein
MSTAVQVRSLRNTLSLGAGRAIVRLICGFISVKLTAVYLGPSGMALIAQFNNFLSLCHGIVATGLETAATRLTSEYAGDAGRRGALLHTLGKIAAVLGFVTALAVAASSPWLAAWLLNDPGYAWVFVLGSLAILASIANALLLAVLSARDGYVRSNVSIILATILGLVIFAPAAMRWGIAGGLFATSAVYLGSLAITLALLHRSGRVRLSDFIGRFERAEARRVAAFYPMLIVHAAMAPLSLILIRQHVSSVLDLHTAGLWQACWRLSETYLLVVMSMISTQFMVRLGRVVNDPPSLRTEVVRTLAIAVGGTALIASFVYLLRDWIVRILFSPEFSPVADLMPMQLVGDVAKMIGWTLGFALVATLRSRWYIAIEIIVPLVFVVVARILGERMGVSGVTTAYAISGLVQAAMAVIAIRDLLFLRKVSHARDN